MVFKKNGGFVFSGFLKCFPHLGKKIIYNLPQLIQQIQNIKMVSLPGAAPNIGGHYIKKKKKKRKKSCEMKRATGR